MDKPLWTPSAERCATSNMARFMEHLTTVTNRSFGSYEALHAYSVEEPGEFWSELWSYTEVVGEKGAKPYLEAADQMPGATFFPRARLNYAENLLRRSGGDPALVFWGEDKVRRRVSWDALRLEVGRLQTVLVEAGLAEGDRIAAMLPNCPEAITGLLAASATGVVWSSCSPDFGVQGVVDRFGQIGPRILIVCDGYYYGGKAIDIADKLGPIVDALGTLERIIVVPYLGRADGVASGLDGRGGRKLQTTTWTRAVSDRPPCEPQFKQLPFSHPLYILYSSGTTGVPKCIVHSSGGALLKHKSEHVFHTDVKPGDRVFYFTTLGWMMWNWLASGLAAEATLLLYDGSPFHPTGNALWDYAAAERCTHFGTSAKYIDALKKSGLRPGDSHNLSDLRALMSTGSPLAPESFDYIYEGIKSDLHLASISGGTDICGCFVLGNPVKPVYRGEIQSPALGLAVDVADEEARPLASGKGELVCRNAFPSMPIGFWGDTNGQRYRSAYYERFPGLWHHGDFAEWTPHGGMIIHGRSDATLNPGGVRIGTAEIYRQVEQLPEVQESIVIGQDFDNDVRVVLFVVLKAGHHLSEDLVTRIKQKIRTGASPRHVPAKIIEVRDIPRTKSGKITELAVRDIVAGRDVKNKDALANPEALDLYRDLPELKS